MRALRPALLKRTVRLVVRDVRHRVLRRPWMEVESRDRFLASYPRSGNTWLRHMLYFYLHDTQTVDMRTLDEFCPLLDAIELQERLARMEDWDLRFIKTHELGADYLLNGKVILLVRDGRDAIWSWHRYRLGFGKAPGDFDAFLRLCLDDRIRYHAWHTNLGSWLPFIDSPRVLMVKFEAFRADPEGNFARILAHMDVPIDPARIAKAVSLASQETVNASFRTEIQARHAPGDGSGQGGIIERWRTVYTPAQLRLFNEKAGPVLTAFGYPLAED